MWRSSEYASGCNYGRVPDIPGFWVYHISVYVSFALCSEYAWWTFHKILNKPLFLNMSGLRIWQGCEYARVTQGAEYTWINLNMP